MSLLITKAGEELCEILKQEATNSTHALRSARSPAPPHRLSSHATPPRSFGTFCFFALQLLLLLGVTHKTNPRISLHTGWWPIKCVQLRRQGDLHASKLPACMCSAVSTSRSPAREQLC